MPFNRSERRWTALATAAALALLATACTGRHTATPAERAKALSEAIETRPECAQYRQQLAAPGLDHAAVDAIYSAAKKAGCTNRDG